PGRRRHLEEIGHEHRSDRLVLVDLDHWNASVDHLRLLALGYHRGTLRTLRSIPVLSKGVKLEVIRSMKALCRLGLASRDGLREPARVLSVPAQCRPWVRARSEPSQRKRPPKVNKCTAVV